MRPSSLSFLLLVTVPGCLIDRSALTADTTRTRDAEVELDGSRDAAFIAEHDAPPEEDADPGTDAGCPAERCNARDDDCDGHVDEGTACDRTVGAGAVECASFTDETSIYQICKSSVGLAYGEAEVACFRGTGYDLLRIDTAEEGARVAAMLGGDAWIGLSDQEIEGRFVWSRDRVEDTLGNWAPDEPDSKRGDGDRVQNCVVLSPSALWADRACGTPGTVGTSAIGYFVCEAPLTR